MAFFAKKDLSPYNSNQTCCVALILSV